ncbi:DUF1707 domain-containing protein [Pseudonocardia sp.]|uniref:DUF1707 domain-containing protein n=1 Tax=Pseudonocardia sp. TaxID=60912 RepID=UPI0026116EA6|nr:DUF1707 domain-containing protein [Pseudonocardia sp.]
MSTPEPHRIRVGDADREAAVAELGEHLTQGRLDAHEYAERTAAAYQARTDDELACLFVDLPRPYTPPAPYAYPVAAPLADDAPYGRDPHTGQAYSDRHKVVAGVLQLVLPFGAGRFYSGHIGLGVAQLLLSLMFVGIIWSFIDGLVILAGRPTDPYGRPLRP